MTVKTTLPCRLTGDFILATITFADSNAISTYDCRARLHACACVGCEIRQKQNAVATKAAQPIPVSERNIAVFIGEA
jgi:hypothetical protein